MTHQGPAGNFPSSLHIFPSGRSDELSDKELGLKRVTEGYKGGVRS